MGVHRPRRPRGPRRITPPRGASAQAYAAGAQGGWDFAAKLEAIADARRRQAAAKAPPIHQPRVTPTEQRQRRMPTAAELFAQTQYNPLAPSVAHEPDQFELFPAEHDDAAMQLPLWADEPMEEQPRVHRMPTAQELLDGVWEHQESAAPVTSTEYYSPTASIYPPRPRTLEMSYDRTTRILRVVYRDGGTYDYFDVPGPIWYRIRNVKSPGRFIDRNIKGAFEFEKVAL